MVRPVTDSSKVKVTGIGELRVELPTVVDTVTLGLTLSKVRVKVAEAVLPLVAVSIATPAASEISMGPSPVGVMLAE
jgi:hypothetical protein